MKNISTGAGLAILGLGIAAHPILSNFGSSAAASASTAPIAAAVAATANAQSGPTVVWMGVTTFVSGYWVYHRLWSDGRPAHQTNRRIARPPRRASRFPGRACWLSACR